MNLHCPSAIGFLIFLVISQILRKEGRLRQFLNQDRMLGVTSVLKNNLLLLYVTYCNLVRTESGTYIFCRQKQYVVDMRCTILVRFHQVLRSLFFFNNESNKHKTSLDLLFTKHVIKENNITF